MSLASVMRAEALLLLPTYERHPVLFRRGRGVYLWDANGKRYLDFLSGIGVNALGYGHPKIQGVLRQQAGRLVHVSNLFFHDYQAALATQLTRLSGLERVFFCNSGTEAWEGALKLARAYARMQNHNGHKPKWRILALQHSFHGRTFGSLATTGQVKYRAPFAPVLPGVSFVRFNDIEDLQKKFDRGVCAVCLETVQGEGGIRPVSKEFLHAARKLTKTSGSLLILDEIQCGLGRTGLPFAYQHYGIKPDIVTVAKPLAAGLPLGAILTTNRVALCMHPGLHGTTFGGGPLACAVAVAFLKEMERHLPQIRSTGDYFREQLEILAGKHDCVREVRGLGLMVAMELDSAETAKRIVRVLMSNGIILNRTHDTVLRFLPPYIIERKHVNEVVASLDAAFRNKTSQSADPSHKTWRVAKRSKG